MFAKNPRLNITFDPDAAIFLAWLAKQEHKSTASVARELIMEALERREDLALSKIAALRDNASAKIFSHKDAWK